MCRMCRKRPRERGLTDAAARRTGLASTHDVQTLIKSIFAHVRDARWRVKEVREAMETATSAASGRDAGFRSVFVAACGKAVEKGGFSEHECYVASRLMCAVMSAMTLESEDGLLAKSLETLARLRAKGAKAF